MRKHDVLMAQTKLLGVSGKFEPYKLLSALVSRGLVT